MPINAVFLTLSKMSKIDTVDMKHGWNAKYITCHACTEKINKDFLLGYRSLWKLTSAIWQTNTSTLINSYILDKHYATFVTSK